MNIIALTDIHGRLSFPEALLEEIRTADLLLLSGDITHFGHRAEMERMIGFLRNLNPRLLAVSGNCDHPDAEAWLSEAGISLHTTLKETGGIAFYGLSGSLPCPGRTPHEYEEEVYEALLAGFTPPPQPWILVSHQPPFGTVNDAVSPGVHVGSKSIRAFIERTRPLACFCGHIHEGVGTDRIGDTVTVNAGPARFGGFSRAEMVDGQLKNIRITQPKPV